MSPIGPFVWMGAVAFQVVNGLSIGGYLGGYGPTTRAEWQQNADFKVGGRMELGMMIWALGFIANVWHDDELREIRRAAKRNLEKKMKGSGEKDKSKVDKVYMMPQNGLFNYILYPHYLCEWIEWTGFWIMAGSGAIPMRNFVINEIATMFPRALSGKQWYIGRFGNEKVANRKAILPGII